MSDSNPDSNQNASTQSINQSSASQSSQSQSNPANMAGMNQMNPLHLYHPMGHHPLHPGGSPIPVGQAIPPYFIPVQHQLVPSINQSTNQSKSYNSPSPSSYVPSQDSQSESQSAAQTAPYTGRCAVVGCDRLSTHISFRHKGVYHGARIPEVSRLPIIIDETHRRVCFQCLDLHRRQSGRLARENGLSVVYFSLPHRYHTTPRSKSMYDYEEYRPHPCIRLDSTGQYHIVCTPESGFSLVDPNREHREQLKMKREHERTTGTTTNPKPVERKHRPLPSHGVDDMEEHDGTSRKRSRPNQSISQSISQSYPPGTLIFTVNHRYTLQLGSRPQTIITDVLAQCLDINRANLIALSSMSQFDVGSMQISIDDGLVSILVQSQRDYRSYEVYVERQPLDRETAMPSDVDKFITQLRGN